MSDVVTYDVRDGKVVCTINAREVQAFVARRLRANAQKLPSTLININVDDVRLNETYTASAEIRQGVSAAKRVACRRAQLKLAEAVVRQQRRIVDVVNELSKVVNLELLAALNNAERCREAVDDVLF